MTRWALLGTLSLAGCVNMSGLEGGSSYACAAPSGVACDSVSGTYANSLNGRLPSQRHAVAQGIGAPAPAMGSSAPREPATAPPRPPVPAGSNPPATPAGEESMPTTLRAPARILRLWTKPWEDADGDLWDQGYVYVQIDAGHWQLDHLRQRIRETFAPLRPPPATPAGHEVPPAEQGSPPHRPAEGTPPGATPSPFSQFPALNRPLPAPLQRQP